MKLNINYKRGDKIVENGRVYFIFKTEQIRSEGKSESVVHYRPFFVNSTNRSILGSIPEKNIETSNIRRPASKGDIGKILQYLSEKTDQDLTTDDLAVLNDMLKLNSSYEYARVLKKCLSKLKSAGEKFSLDKKGIIYQTVGLMLEEIALVMNISLDKAHEEITTAAKSYYSKLA